jgi:hypothetical protein
MNCKNIQEIEISQWFFWATFKIKYPIQLIWQQFFLRLPSNSHCGNKNSCIFLQYTHQVDMKNVVKCWKDFTILEAQFRSILCLRDEFEFSVQTIKRFRK